MYCIIDKSYKVWYLCWNWANGGYFFTSKDAVEKLVENNTKEHPFLFNSEEEATEFLNTDKYNYVNKRNLIIKEFRFGNK